jgi:hypothetical protein
MLQYQGFAGFLSYYKGECRGKNAPGSGSQALVFGGNDLLGGSVCVRDTVTPLENIPPYWALFYGVFYR